MTSAFRESPACTPRSAHTIGIQPRDKQININTRVRGSRGATCCLWANHPPYACIENTRREYHAYIECIPGSNAIVSTRVAAARRKNRARCALVHSANASMDIFWCIIMRPSGDVRAPLHHQAKIRILWLSGCGSLVNSTYSPSLWYTPGIISVWTLECVPWRVAAAFIPIASTLCFDMQLYTARARPSCLIYSLFVCLFDVPLAASRAHCSTRLMPDDILTFWRVFDARPYSVLRMEHVLLQFCKESFTHVN